MIINRDLKDKIDTLSDRVYWLQNHNDNNLEYNPPVLISCCRFVAYRFQNSNSQLAIASVATGNRLINSAIDIVKPNKIHFYLDFEEDAVINYTRDFSQDSICQSIYRLTIEKIKDLNSILIYNKFDSKEALEYTHEFLSRSYEPIFQLYDFLGKTLDKIELLNTFNQQLIDLDCHLTMNDFKRFDIPLIIKT